MKNKPQSRQSNLVVQDLENEILIYDLNINKVYCLNETSAMVWQLCDGKRTVSDIARQLSKKLRIEVSDDFVWLALDRLKKDNLLENSEGFEINFGNLNRRQVIKKVGLASMIALPLSSSLVAPKAIAAQSQCGICPTLGCGSFSDGCGNILNCGDCTVPQFCGGGGVPNICGGFCLPLR